MMDGQATEDAGNEKAEDYANESDEYKRLQTFSDSVLTMGILSIS